jgi:hypothetical protein
VRCRTEPFILALLAFHTALLALAIFTRRHMNFQIFLWASIRELFFLSISCTNIRFTQVVLLGFGARALNEYGAVRWQEFATQNYFDTNGLFISFLFSLPLFLIAFYLTVRGLK